jgi:hypothetical protein
MRLALLAALSLTGCPTPEEKGEATWMATCGDPDCQEDGWVDKGLPDCTDEAVGDPCDTLDAACDPRNDCNVTLVCTTEDPATECPISRRSAKSEIRYLAGKDRQALADRLLGTRLAEWRYKGDHDDGRRHYGFIIEDDPTLPAADPERGVVDLYTWATMSAAAAQEQAARIEAQQAQIDALQAELAAIRAEVAANRR